MDDTVETENDHIDASLVGNEVHIHASSEQDVTTVGPTHGYNTHRDTVSGDPGHVQENIVSEDSESERDEAEDLQQEQKEDVGTEVNDQRVPDAQNQMNPLRVAALEALQAAEEADGEEIAAVQRAIEAERHLSRLRNDGEFMADNDDDVDDQRTRAVDVRVPSVRDAASAGSRRSQATAGVTAGATAETMVTVNDDDESVLGGHTQQQAQSGSSSARSEVKHSMDVQAQSGSSSARSEVKHSMDVQAQSGSSSARSDVKQSMDVLSPMGAGDEVGASTVHRSDVVSAEAAGGLIVHGVNTDSAAAVDMQDETEMVRQVEALREEAERARCVA